MKAQTVSDVRVAGSESYDTLRVRHLKDMRAQVPGNFERLAWPRERLWAERERSLRNLLRTAKSRSRWHRERLRHIDAETFTEEALASIREAIVSAWNATLLNMWATTEGLGMAASCGHGPGMHLTEDLVIVEPVDEAGAPVAPGVRSAKVLITPLYSQEPLPLLRYEITDEVTLLEQPCPCGSAHRLITDIQGRLDDIFDYGAGTKVHPHIFRSRLAQERAVVEYQVTQTTTGADIAVRCSGKADVTRLREALIADLRRLGLSAPQVAITEVARIERPKSGKLKRFAAMSRAA